MAAPAIQNPASRPESKTGKKKKSKAEAAVSSPSIASPVTEDAPTNGATESGDGSYESPYIKELYK
jgi:hypothetical protein